MDAGVVLGVGVGAGVVLGVGVGAGVGVSQGVTDGDQVCRARVRVRGKG